MPTNLDRNSKADTHYLGFQGEGDYTDMAVDQSQERTDLAVSASYLRETSSARLAITYPRELSVCFRKKTGDAGIMINHGTSDGVSWTYRMRVSGNDLDCSENGALRVSLTLPGVAGTDRRFLAHWSTRQDLFDPTKVRSELSVYNFDTGVWAHAFATHNAATTNTGWDFNVAGYGAGTLAYDVRDILSVRVGKRFHSQAEAHEDWVDESTKPALLGRVRDAALPIVADIGVEGEFAGPAYLHAGATARDVDRRLVSPLVNVRMPSEFVIAKADHTDSGSRRLYRPAPGDPQFYLHAGQWWYVPVPAHMNKARVRAFIRMWSVDLGPCSMIYKAVSWANVPFAGEPLEAPVIYRTGGTFLSEDHASGGGEWVELGDLHLARDEFGCTSICIAHSFEFGVDSDEVDDTRFAVLAVTVEPYYLPSDPGFDITI